MTERRRRFLLLSSLALVTSSVCGLAFASSSAATPPTTLAPTPEPPAPEPPAPEQPTVAPPTTQPATTILPPTTAELPTSAAPTTLDASTTTIEAAEPAAPSVVYAANADCDPATGETTVSWRVTNNGEAPLTITGNTEDVPLEPNPVPPFGEATATRVIEGPATDQQVTSTVTIDAGGGVVIEESDDVTAAACLGPEAPADVTFTFSVRPSVTQAAVGDTVEYVYCGQNTSTIPLQVGRIVDDRIGLIYEGGRVVGPGEAVCNTDVGAPFSYVVQEADAGSVIHNNAVVTVQTQEDEPREFQQTATAEVLVPLLSAQPLTGIVAICHATNSLTNTYEQNVVSQSAVQEGGHHYNHEDDIIPPGPWAEDGRNWTAEGEALWNNGCVNIKLSPVSPAVVQASCVGGVVTAPTVTPATTTGIDYAVNPTGPFSGIQNYNVMVTATLDGGFNWGPMPTGWTQISRTTARFPVTLTAASCEVKTPGAPGVTQAECRDGVLQPPTLTPVTTDDITYTFDPPIDPQAPYAPGQTVVVTATLTEGEWPETLPPLWTRGDNVTATYEVTFAEVSCLTATPADPFVLESGCVGGEVTDPTVAPVAAPGVTYTIDPEGPYDGTETTPVTVTATVANGYAWGPLPPGWSAGDPAATTRVFPLTLDAASCTGVAPLDPTVVQAECVGGVVRTASVTPATGPTGVSYALGSVPAPGTTVVVTATVAVGYAWVDELPLGWSEGDPATARATFTVTLAAAETCTGVTPQDPTVRQALCVNGAVTTPTITLATGPEGVSYALGGLPAPGTTVTVTATVGRGNAWAEPEPEGWTYVNASTATFEAVLAEAETCTGVTPEDPTVRQALCVNGAVTTPTITLATGPEGVSYALGGLPAPGTTVTVTATVGRGNAWAEPEPEGWTYVNASTATFEAVLAEAETCTGVTPQDPTVRQALCVNGAVTTPTITLATGPEGVSYAMGGLPAPGTTVTVTATVGRGNAWAEPEPEGWTYVNASTATFEAVLAEAETCTGVTPEDPTVRQALCVNGAVTTPTITLATGPEGVSYALGGLPAPGTTVTVTATVGRGNAWAEPEPEGWTYVNASTATFEAVLAEAETCTGVTPQDPTVRQALCVNGAVTTPTITLATGPEGVSYALGGLPAPGTTVTVTATVGRGNAWAEPEPEGWTYVNASTATFEAVLAEAETCTGVTPQDPTVRQALCVNGAVTTPTITLATGPEGVSYALGGLPAPGTTVTVTATVGRGNAWAEPEPEGWTYVNASTATFEAVLAEAETCTGVTPQDPTVRQALCVNGAVTTPTITLATGPEGVSYALGGLPAPGTTVTVTATVGRGNAWAEPEPEGWTYVNASTATFEAVLAEAETCTGVTPQDPTVRQALCVNGAVTTPTITLATGPEGVSYALGGLPAPGTTVTVTATVGRGNAWNRPLPDGWTEVNPATATFTVTLTTATCTPVTPIEPELVHATCADGVVTEMSVVPAAGPTGVQYVVDPPGPFPGTSDASGLVSAVLDDGYAWGAIEDPWEPLNATTVTTPYSLIGTTCDEVTPVPPTVSQAACAAGVLEPPTLTLPELTDGITYTVDPPIDPQVPYASGQTVVVTATLDDTDVAWPDELPVGWDETSDTTATYEVSFKDVSCTLVTPTDPTVTDATCVNGDATAPTVILPSTPGILYAAEPPGPYDSAVETDVVVTATVIDGFAWGGSSAQPGGSPPTPVELPEGWTWVSPIEATFDITLDALPPCPTTELVAPDIVQAECVDGEATEPSVQPVETEGVENEVAPSGPWTQGELVTVTATITDPETGWADPPAEGWEVVGPSTATYEVTFEVIECVAATTSTTTSPSTTAASTTTVGPSASTSSTPTDVAPTTTAAPTAGPTTTAAAAEVPTTTAAPTTAPAAPADVVVAGNAVCAPESGQTTLMWTVRNLGGSPVTITGDDRGVSFTPTQLLASTGATGSEVVDGPAADEAITETVSVDLGGGQTTQAAATMTVPACTGPMAPPDITFSFTNDPSVPVAEVGETVAYSYCGENTSDVPLEVVRVVDDRYGVLELPEVATVIEPGESFCNTDIDLEVTYEVQPDDQGSTIVNNAVVTVRTVGAEPQAFQAADPAEVEVPGAEVPQTR